MQVITKIPKILLVALLGFTINCSTLFAQFVNLNYSELSKRVKAIEKNGTGAKVNSIGKTIQQNDIWVIQLSQNPKPEEQPAILILAGTDPSSSYTVELALKIAENLSSTQSQDSLRGMLKNTTFYIIPNLDPDASERLFATPRFGYKTNLVPYDDDKDGLIDEDDYDDLNKDGLITLMRIADSTGSFRVSNDDERIMVKAKLNKGETGTHKVLFESIDNDKDGLWSEDLKGGECINQSFSYNYQWFQPGSGKRQFSHVGALALADFLLKTPNCQIVYSIGPDNNLYTPWEGKIENQKIPSAPTAEDAKVYEALSEAYKQSIGSTNATFTSTIPKGGQLLEWAYFHFGRFSIGAPGWSLSLKPFKYDSTQSTINNIAIKKKIQSENFEVKYLYWLESNGINGSFIPWQKVIHPDFPNRTVEVGGFVPNAASNLPLNVLDTLVPKQINFCYALSKKLSRIQFVEIKTEALADNIYRLSIKIANPSLLPTHSDIAKDLKFILLNRCELNLTQGQKLIAGNPKTTFGALKANQSFEYSWHIQGKGKVSLTAISPTGGKVSQILELK